jgi:hypothetical protein
LKTCQLCQTLLNFAQLCIFRTAVFLPMFEKIFSTFSKDDR